MNMRSPHTNLYSSLFHTCSVQQPTSCFSDPSTRRQMPFVGRDDRTLVKATQDEQDCLTCRLTGKASNIFELNSIPHHVNRSRSKVPHAVSRLTYCKAVTSARQPSVLSCLGLFFKIVDLCQDRIDRQPLTLLDRVCCLHRSRNLCIRLRSRPA